MPKPKSPVPCAHCGESFSRSVSLEKFCSAHCKLLGNIKKILRRPTLGECWEWTAGKCRDGYGKFWFEKRHRKAHQVSYELFSGPIAEGLFVCHTCDNPSCVNPDHLFLGSGSDNAADMVEKKRHAFGEKHHKAKLTENDVRWIRWLYRNRCAKQQELSDAFGVNDRSVSHIVNNKTWKYVT